MKRKLSSFFYKLMVKGLAKALDSDVAPTPKKDDLITADEGAELSFIAFGDPQISALSPLRSARFYSALSDVENSGLNFDALVLAGDITEYGALCEYRMTARLINRVAKQFKKILIVPGNHDVRIRNFKKQLKRFNAFLGHVENAVQCGEDNYFYTGKINGYKFIMLGPDRNAFEASYLSDSQLDRIETELDRNETGKPVFVINHYPLKLTNGLPESWMGKGSWRGSVGAQSDRLKAIFERHGKIVYITGHLHYGISAFNYEDYGSYKCISLPTVGVLNHGLNSKLGQGYVFSVKGNRVTARGRCFCEGSYYESETDNAVVDFEC